MKFMTKSKGRQDDEVTASVVLFNTPHFQLSRLLDSIKYANLISKVYLIDNSPNINFSNLYFLPWVIYIHSPENIGYGAGHNIAIREIINQSEFHFILNPDIYFEPEAIHLMISRIRQDETIGQLMPKVIYPDGSLQYLCKLIPTPMDLIVRRFFRGPLKAIALKQVQQFELRFTGYNKEMEIPILSGCFMLFRISALKKVGLFDERYFMYLEDFDLTRRMHSHFRTIFFPLASVVHDHAKESYKFNKMLYFHILSAIKYFNKWGWVFDAEREVVNARVIKSLKD
jgi:GT2 family glycosyltransferase